MQQEGAARYDKF